MYSSVNVCIAMWNSTHVKHLMILWVHCPVCVQRTRHIRRRRAGRGTRSTRPDPWPPLGQSHYTSHIEITCGVI